MLLVIVNVFVATAFAGIPLPEAYTSIDQKSNLCDKNVHYSIDTAQSYARRGRFFASADVAIRDEGNGDIGVSAHANLREPVKEMYISLYLDRYNQEKDAWQQVDYVDFEYTPEDYPDGVDDQSIEITFTNQKEAITTVLEQLSPQAMMIGMKALDQLPKASGSNNHPTQFNPTITYN